MSPTTLTLTLLRIVAGVLFFSHGAQKLFGWFGGMGPGGGTASLMSLMGAAGVIEVVAGVGIALGLATRPLAFIASGEMAVAYFWSHVRRQQQYLVVGEPRRGRDPVLLPVALLRCGGGGAAQSRSDEGKR